MSDIPTTTRDLIQQRALGLCERCGNPGTDIHHRQPRQMGGTNRPDIHDPPNLLLLCRTCHTHIERHRDYAYETGWLVHSWDTPADISIVVWMYRMEVWLEPDGGYRLYPLPTNATCGRQ